MGYFPTLGQFCGGRHDVLDDAFNLRHDLSVGEAYSSEAPFRKYVVALLVHLASMRVAIDFHNQSVEGAQKVYDEWLDDFLPTKSVAGLRSTQMCP